MISHRRAGILLPVSSLPSRYGIGCFSKEAYDFVDALAEAAWQVEGVLGSRMTGGGFGGCTVSLVKDEAIEHFKAFVGAEYEKKTGLKANFYVAEIGDGVMRLA